MGLDTDLVERRAMEEVLNRICRAADREDENVMFMIDAISEDQRSRRLPNMYAHILGRAVGKPEMRRAVEPPMHIDSQLSAAIQFADWVAAILGRALEYQLLADSDCRWVGEALWEQRNLLFTKESKLHLLPGRAVSDLHNWDVLKRDRPLLASGSVVADPETARKMERLFQQTRSQK
ncbi:No significant database matches [Leucobacter sp. 7(1)]|nr:No significant database matches [Leucobacter sp. 7(1)]